MGLGTRIVAGAQHEYAPSLDDSPVRAYIPLQRWWEQVVYVLSPELRLRRRDIVLTAANKDGGAHVDAELTPEYDALVRDGAFRGICLYIRHDKSVSVQPVTGAHLVALRQMGYKHAPQPRSHGAQPALTRITRCRAFPSGARYVDPSRRRTR